VKQKAFTSNKAVIYARVSSKEQEREGYSIPAQKKLLTSYAQKPKQSGRTHFNEMVQYLEENPKVGTILCEKTDRLYRNFKDYVIINDLVVTLVFVKEGSVLNRHSRSHEKFIHGIKVLMAKNYIDNLSEETRKGLLEKAEEGEFPALAPLGYRHDTVNKTIELDEKRAPIIKEMFELYAAGRYSVRRLQTYLTDKGLRTRKGNRVMVSSVAEMLKNPFYYGDFIWAGKQYHGTHPPIIDEELFDRVQAVISSKNRPPRQSKHSFAYTGLMKCAKCGCSITAEIRKGRYVYYHCTFGKGRCGGKSVREEELKRQFGEIFKKFQFPEKVFKWTREALRMSQKEKAEFHRKAIEGLNARYLKLQNRIDQMYLDKLDGEVDEAFYIKHMKEWREDQKRLQRQIEAHQEADENYIEQGIRLIEIARNAYSFYQSKDQPIRAELIRFIFPNSNLRDGKVEPVFKPPFDIIWKMAREARKYKPVNKKQAASKSAACPIALPLLDQLRMYCYTNRIEIPSFLAA
jgi:DNA invertase Pin-like site-specific DNA recombinase